MYNENNNNNRCMKVTEIIIDRYYCEEKDNINENY